MVTQSHVSLRGHKAVPMVRPTGAGMWRSLSAQGGVGTAGLQSPVVPWVLPSPGAWRGLMEGTGRRVMTAATPPWVSAEPPWAVPHPHSCCPEQSQARCQRDVGSQKKIQPQNVFRGSSIPECVTEKRHKGGFLCWGAGFCLAGSPVGQRGRIRPWDAVCAELGGRWGERGPAQSRGLSESIGPVMLLEAQDTFDISRLLLSHVHHRSCVCSAGPGSPGVMCGREVSSPYASQSVSLGKEVFGVEMQAAIPSFGRRGRRNFFCC